jgi:hypothetical protein
MDQESPGWCEAHAELFRNNGAPPEEIFRHVIRVLARAWQERTGLTMQGDEDSVKQVLVALGGDRPFCCRLGDEKLQRILIAVSTDVEKMKESQDVQN